MLSFHFTMGMALLLALALAIFDPSSSLVFKASVSCLHCHRHYDFSGINVIVKCDQVKKLVVLTTQNDGSVETKLPSLNCIAKLAGGPSQLYATRNNMVAQILKSEHKPNTYTIATPLAFSTTCPKDAICSAPGTVGSSKTIDIPLPREWGLAPSSYYVPFFPIIGIP